MDGIDRRLRSSEKPTIAILLTWLAVSAILLIVAANKIISGDYHGPDDALRMVQVRDLLAGQGWYDLHQYRMTPPEGTLMHWSRLVDIPIAAMVLFFSLFLEPALAERAALLTTPLLVLLATLMVLGRLAWRVFDRQTAIFACATFIVMPLIAVQYQPTRIDHHGWQIFTVVLATWALTWRSAVKGGTLAGLAMAVGLMISLEPIFMSAAFGVILFWRWWRNPKDRWWLVSYLQALALGLVALFSATRGLPDLAPHCDAISPPHLGFFLIAALGTGALAIPATTPRVPLVLGFLVVGLLGVGFVAWSAPQCLAPPFANLDPLVAEFWYASVSEGRPLWDQKLTNAIPAVIQPLIALGVVMLLASQSRDWKRQWWAEYAVILLIAFMSGVMTFRSMAFAGALCAIPFGWIVVRVFARWKNYKSLLPKLGLAVGVYLVFLPAAPFIIAKELAPKSATSTGQTFGRSSCDMRDNAPLLNSLAPGRIFAPLDVGPVVLYYTDHSVVASGHHRAETAMHDVITAFTSDADTAQRIIDDYEAQYVFVCTDLLEPLNYSANGGDQAFMTRLIEGDAPQWLDEVEIGGPEAFRAWRVVPPTASE